MPGAGKVWLCGRLMREGRWERPFPNLPISRQINYNTPMIESRTLEGLISKDPQIHNGRPTIAGTGNTVRAIAIMYKQGLTPEEITVELPLSLAQVYAALTYYHLNTDEIEADIRRDSEAELKEKYGRSING